MTTVFADTFRAITLNNNVVRIELVRTTGQETVETTGVLLLPANQARTVINGLSRSLDRLDEQLKAQQQQREPETDAPEQGEGKFGFDT